MYCIVLNKFYCNLFRDDFTLKFKKQSENLKHYEGEHCKNWRRTDGRTDTIGVELKALHSVGRKSTTTDE